MNRQQMSKQEIETANGNDALEIIKTFLSGDPMAVQKDHLRDMMDAYFMYHENPRNNRDGVYATFLNLKHMIESISILEIAINGTKSERPPVM